MKRVIEDSVLKDIADVIREKTETNSQYEYVEMPEGVQSVYTAGQADGYKNGYSQGLIDGEKEDQEKFITITENGKTEILPDENKVLSKVTVDVDVADNYYDTFWDTFQQNGERTAYATAFADGYFNSKSFKPKYDIKPTSCQNMFSRFPDEVDLRDILNTCGITLDFSNVTTGNYTFNSSKLTALPALNCPNGYLYWFMSCSLLHTIDKIVFNKEMSTTQLNAFSHCSALKNIVIEGEIGMSINLGDSPNLTGDSVDSIGNAVIDLTDLETQIVTFNKAVIERMTDEQKAVFTNKNWTIVSKG